MQDYYAFGMQMPGRKLSGGYRYGFNGKENDNEVKGEGNQQDYGMRMYDGRIGKFLSVDPLTKSYPQLTPYQFAENSPIHAIDLDGLEKYVVTNWFNNENVLRKITVKAITSNNTNEVVDLNFKKANGGDLTNKNVYVRSLYLNGKTQSKPIERNELTQEEQKLFKSAKAGGPHQSLPNDESIGYDFTDQVGGDGISEEFDIKGFHFMEAEKRLPLLKKLDFSYKNGLYAYLGTADDLGGGVKNGTLDFNFPGGEEIVKLLKDIKEDGQIRSAEITFKANVSNVSESAFQSFKRGVEYAGPQYKKLFEKAGVKKVSVTTTALRDNQQQAGTSIKLIR